MITWATPKGSRSPQWQEHNPLPQQHYKRPEQRRWWKWKPLINIERLNNNKYDGNENIENDLEYPDSVKCDGALAAELEDENKYKDDEEDHPQRHHQHHHRRSSPGGRTWVQGWLGRGGGRAAWRCRGSEILEEEVPQIQSPSLPGPPGYCHEDSGFPEIDFHVTRFQIMVPLPISIPRGNKNLTGHRIEGPNGKIGDYACWQCSRQVISHIKYPCTWQQQISNFPFPFSFFLYYNSREGGQVVLMWLFAPCTFYLMNIFIFLKATMRNHLMPPPQALKFLQIFLFLFVIQNIFFSLVFGSGFAKLLVI